jgi:hypothetical protein
MIMKHFAELMELQKEYSTPFLYEAQQKYPVIRNPRIL